MVGVNLLRAAIVFAVFLLVVVPPLAIVVVLGLMYLVYGLPFEIVVHDADFSSALQTPLLTRSMAVYTLGSESPT